MERGALRYHGNEPPGGYLGTYRIRYDPPKSIVKNDIVL